MAQLKSPFQNWLIQRGILPTEFVESHDVYESLCWLVNYLNKVMLPAINNNDAEYQKQYREYVKLLNWFKNLDVQSEINIKLDEMTRDGTLDQIINNQIFAELNREIQDLQSYKYSYAVNTVEDLIAGNFHTGDIVITAGYHTVNDQGGGRYIITDSGVANNMDILSLTNGKYACLIYDDIPNVKQFGAWGDGLHQHDDEPIQRCIDVNTTQVFIPKGHYLLNNGIHCQNKTIKGSQYTDVTLDGYYMTNPNTGILAIGLSTNVDNITVTYTREKLATSGTSSTQWVGFKLAGGYDTDRTLQHASITNCQASFCNTGIWDGDRSVFSCTFENIIIQNVKSSGIKMTGPYRTGNVYSNIYITNIGFTHNDNQPDDYQCSYGFYLVGEESEATISQLNVEHMTCWAAIRFENNGCVTVTSAHIEGVKLRGGYEGYVYIKDTDVTFGGLGVYYTRESTAPRVIRIQNTRYNSDTKQQSLVVRVQNLMCKGLNRPDYGTYGSPQPGLSNLTNFFFVGNEDSQTNQYIMVYIDAFNFITFGGNPDVEVYRAFPTRQLRLQSFGSNIAASGTTRLAANVHGAGMMNYDTTTSKFVGWNGSSYVNLS